MTHHIPEPVENPPLVEVTDVESAWKALEMVLDIRYSDSIADEVDDVWYDKGKPLIEAELNRLFLESERWHGEADRLREALALEQGRYRELMRVTKGHADENARLREMVHDLGAALDLLLDQASTLPMEDRLAASEVLERARDDIGPA